MKISSIVSAVMLLIVLNACQGRNMPVPSPTTTTKKMLSIPSTVELKEEIKPIHNVKPKHMRVTTKPKKISIPLIHKVPHIHKKRKKDIDTHKIVSGLPPLPNIPSIDNIVPESIPQRKRVYPIRKKMIQKPTEVLINDIIRKRVSQPRESFSGGAIANELDMATIRIGKSSDYTSIIFDSYQYAGRNTIPTKKSSVSGTYLFTYEPSKNSIVGLIDGYRSFSALMSDQRKLFSDSKVVENIYVLKHIGNDGIKFVIKLRKNVRVNIFDVKNPGRIIVNLFPL